MSVLSLHYETSPLHLFLVLFSGPGRGPLGIWRALAVIKTPSKHGKPGWPEEKRFALFIDPVYTK